MNCANCDRAIYWSHGILNWCHFDKTISCGERNGYKLFAELKIEEDRKDVCKHCGRDIFHNGKVWVHLKHKTKFCVVIDEVAEPKDDLIILDKVKASSPTGCIKCDEIRYGGPHPIIADRAVCHLIDMGDTDRNDPSYILFMFKGCGKPQSHTPPDFCPLKPKEPELCGILQHAWDGLDISCRLPKGHQGNHDIGVRLNLLLGILQKNQKRPIRLS